MSPLLWVPCEEIGLHARVPLAGLPVCLGFCALAMLAWRALGQKPGWWGSHPCHEGFHGGVLPADHGVARARD
jgi:hypothetical protein